MRKIEFQNGSFYHVYNRGIDKRRVFLESQDFERFYTGMKEFNTINPIGSLYLLNINRKKENLSGPTAKDSEIKEAGDKPEKLVDIIAYSLLPNHYHILIKQLADNGISEYIKRLAGGYTWYFNNRYERSGPLFAGKFKAVHVYSDEYLMQLSAYINGNVEIHKISGCFDWKWSSLKHYVNQNNSDICNKSIILNDFSDIEEYNKILMEVIRNASLIKAAKLSLE